MYSKIVCISVCYKKNKNVKNKYLMLDTVKLFTDLSKIF